jgi:hypothetical protein
LIGFIIVAAMASGTAGQEKYFCTKCAKEITQQAAVIDGKLYHPECFRCAECGEQIRADYIKDTAGHYFHRECAHKKSELPTCSHCFNPITETNYTRYQGKTYHTQCFQNSVAPRCEVCGDPLDNAAITDFWGNRFHPRHAKEFPICVVCGRLVQRDGSEIESNRWMCPICLKMSVTSTERARQLLEEVREQLASSGIVVTTLGLRVELVTSAQLSEGRRGSGTAHAYAGILWNSGKSDLGDEIATIKALTGLPDDLLRGVIAHELMHIWQHENGVDAASLELREGSANWASTFIYGALRNDRGRYYIGGLEKSNDPLYGVGYRNIAKYADNNGVEGVLRMLKQEGADAAKKKKGK